MKDVIAIVGSGLMGRGLAKVFALAEHKVNIYDAYKNVILAAPDIISQELTLLAQSGLIEERQAIAAGDNIYPFTELDQAVQGAGLVIECAPEKMDLKREIFKELDGICPENAILATNTSVMSVTEIGVYATHRERIIGTHFWNPPHIIPLVEVVQTEYTTLKVIEKTMDILQKAGKKPIHVKKDVPGFVGNRMQHALWREAFYLLDEGIADAKTIDDAIRYGFGLRLPKLGPMENADMIGLDLALDIHEYILKYLCDSKTPSKRLRDLVNSGHLGFKSGGQGFQTWSESDMEKSRKDLIDYLVSYYK
ncbi:MAG: 3-hydroxyacyl-CoA dehydrogenase family protein [Deltaproteobacteria bacterium]|nr:3-hydroxyacyl-CoA dehydrogenase family protein [Deltaproteobacteria bacterium]